MSSGTESTCVIGQGSAFEGLLSFRASARIDGSLKGRVVGEGTLIVGPDARIDADIRVAALVVSGTIEGEIRALDRVELHAGCSVRGSVQTPRIQVDDGARLEARVQMEAVPPSPSGAPGSALEAP